MPAVINYSDYFVPSNGIPIEEFIDQLDEDYILRWCRAFLGPEVKKKDVSQILKFTTGIESIVTGMGDCESELLLFKKILTPYFQQDNHKQVDFIIYNGGDTISIEKNIPYFIQKEFNLENTQVFHVEQNCSSTLLAIYLAKSLIRTSSAQRILVLSGNIITEFKKRLMSLFTVSDGAGVIEISSGNQGWEIVDFLGTADGTLPTIEDICRNGEKIVNIGVELIMKILKRNQLEPSDISLIIPQNTNLSGWNLYCEKLGIPIDKVYKKNFGGIGHLGDVDMIRNLTDVSRTNEFEKNEYILAYAIGTGTSWNALLLKKI